MTKKYINWAKDVLPTIFAQLKLYTSEQIPMSLRGMFYILVSLNVIENFPARYNYLSRFTTKLRENDTLPMSCFVDEVRHITKIRDTYKTIGKYLQEAIEYIEKAKSEYKIPRWYKQPHYVEVWVEKGTMRGILNAIINVTGKRDVRIVPTAGQESVSFAWENVKRLFDKQMEGKQIHIRYFGDLDPSGENIERNTYDKIWLEPYGLENVDFKRVGVTNEQRIEWHLIPNTDPKTMAKLKRDPNRFVFMKKYGLVSENDLFQIEVDALQAIKPEQFKKMVLGCVDEFFDQNIYIKNNKRGVRKLLPTKRNIIQLAEAMVKDLLTSTEKELTKKRIR